MQRGDGPLSFDGEQFVRLGAHALDTFLKFGMAGRGFRLLRRSEVVANGVRQDEIAISEALH